MSSVLTAEQALKLVGEMFVYHMPFNRALGLELERYEKEFAQLAFNNQPMMVGNWAQSILQRWGVNRLRAGRRRRTGVRGQHADPP
ncbi:Uncharacterised protein [Citrobacter koseri]|uniref:Thioesterase domain-containing protein n=1 Tax=Citrobacter koseri TaxID=545 RepID=A0A2X2WK81_CITKO|nr:Uncharacterised protein [Citrobacter koseri]